MNFKKKAIIGIAAGLFTVATVFNMNMLNENNAGDVSLEAVSVMAQAQKENGGGGGQASICSPIWTVTYTGSLGTSTKVEVSCTTGGAYICPLCPWKG